MKHRTFRALVLALALCAVTLLAACGAPKTQPVPQEDVSMDGTDSIPLNPDTAPENTAGALPTLQELCGEDYAAYIEETILMQMENRMNDKNPELDYFPIAEGKPLTDYVPIDEATPYSLDAEGNPVIELLAGSVADEAHGVQTFAVPKLPQ